MYSLNQFAKLLNTLASAHAQIKTFGEGDVWEIGASGSIQYPLMWAVPQPSSTAQKLLNMKFSILFADVLDPDKANEQDILSDTLQMAMDILAQLNAPNFADDFILDHNTNLTPFTEKFDDDVAGWKLDLNIKINFLSDRCAVPSTLLINPPDPLLAPVIVKNSDGTYSVSFDAGSTGLVPDSVIRNSDDSFSRSLPATASYTIPDSNLTDSDGSMVTLPATRSFSAKTLQQLLNTTSASAIYTDLVTASKLTETVQLLSDADLGNLTTSQLDYITGILSSIQIQLLSDGQLNDLSAVQLDHIVSLLGSTQIGLLSSSQIAELTSAQISDLTSSQVAALSNAQIQQITSSQIPYLTNSQISSLSSSQVQALTNSQIAYMSAAQVHELVSSQLANLSTSQMQYILGSVMQNQFLQDNMNTTQRNSINEIYPIQTGQTTTYAIGDDGNLQRGRLTDFFTLKTNNIFGNTHRFTDEKGQQGYGSNYAIDHATGLGWYTLLQNPATWATAIANTESLKVGSNTYNDFKLPNANELLSIMQYNAVCLNYAPFNLNPVSSAQIWTSTTNYSPTTAALRISYQTFPTASSVAKTAAQPYLLCRKHF